MKKGGVFVSFTLVTEKKSKTYAYDYDEYEEENKGANTMVEDILTDPEFPGLTELVIGDWGGSYENDCQPIIDGIVAHKERFSHIEKLFIGDMDYEECEVSWIMQGNYSSLWAAMPQLKELTIKGSSELVLGEICHESLEALTIICGGLPQSVIEEIENAKLPNLKKLLLYIGIERYGFEGSADTIEEFLINADFPKLEYLGITDSEIQDELAKVVLESKFMDQITTLDLSMGTLTDKGGMLLLERLPELPNVKTLDVHYHYMSDKMVQKLEELPIEVDASEACEPDEYDGELYMVAMLTE